MKKKYDAITFSLRVFTEFDPRYHAYVCRCLETGAVAAEDKGIDLAEQLMRSILVNDCHLAIQHESASSLFHAPSALAIWQSYGEWLQMSDAAASITQLKDGGCLKIEIVRGNCKP